MEAMVELPSRDFAEFDISAVDFVKLQCLVWIQVIGPSPGDVPYVKKEGM